MTTAEISQTNLKLAITDWTGSARRTFSAALTAPGAFRPSSFATGHRTAATAPTRTSRTAKHSKTVMVTTWFNLFHPTTPRFCQTEMTKNVPDCTTARTGVASRGKVFATVKTTAGTTPTRALATLTSVRIRTPALTFVTTRRSATSANAIRDSGSGRRIPACVTILMNASLIGHAHSFASTLQVQNRVSYPGAYAKPQVSLTVPNCDHFAWVSLTVLDNFFGGKCQS